ncbi:type V toxin-antitoxin system endoribonuclease antitoxin GhoS [[Erwinia] mediterraneensis]|uniref:type V toxin-antitoxin system endoribonuclease antitoxin GhoS n=1 Tax=[Erwinia] mediterraneensis TaxID=2161819 RepID=UPI0010305892|nr:type V toxin-antitoxin system endoribonuclease antitoxin GhoS [[Erwinia] mediterraneensis]
MSAAEVKRYIVTFHFHDQGLSDILELDSAMVNGGFSTTLTDEVGQSHELGTHSYGLLSALPAEEITQQATRLGEMVLGQKPEVEVTTLEAFLKP